MRLADTDSVGAEAGVVFAGAVDRGVGTELAEVETVAAVADRIGRGDLVGAEKVVRQERARLQAEIKNPAVLNDKVNRLEGQRKNVLILERSKEDLFRDTGLEAAVTLGYAKTRGRFQELGPGDQRSEPSCAMRTLHQIALMLRKDGAKMPSELLRYDGGEAVGGTFSARAPVDVRTVDFFAMEASF